MEHVISQVSVQMIPDPKKPERRIPHQHMRCTCGHTFEFFGDINHPLADGTMKYPGRDDMPTEYRCPKDVPE
jgi:hypothetical protein